MAITTEIKEHEDKTTKIEGEIKKWLEKISKTLDFIYNNEPEELSVSDALSGNPKFKVCDPYGAVYEPPLKDKIEYIENCSRPEKLYGQTYIKLKNGEEIQAFWRGGRREGWGTILGPRFEQFGVTHLTGEYKDGILSGRGKIFMLNASLREGWFQHGYFHGPARGVTLDGNLDYIGWYRAGTPAGFTWKKIRGDGWLVGNLDSTGQFTGTDIAYLFPDLKTALLGEFIQGELVSAHPAEINGFKYINDVLVPSFESTSDKIYKRWISTNKDFSCPYHLVDPYESKVVTVKASGMEGAGEGLFAKVDIDAGTIVSYYNGLRLCVGESIDGELDETGYAIYLESNLRKDKDAKHLDIPTKYQSCKTYTASLAHKLNHSFNPNCAWDNAEHPVHGLVPAVRTLKPVHNNYYVHCTGP
ncbi:histone-lysine N-methyltransferase SETD7 isoform X2 [Eurytemora carolleeae]|uniref:histone-lysine N-methyltransferase SETD7 isoform X2 n=1 Tax=Eurytemora carolleeae TaxID=1294199 RepID=UPI000C762C4E|nr:histone-lysine N-methyltransferase SETD7 isoform X2 [Eurytemora carolleeae]|eukprot:XP_023325497.1 histone-lysine N-methyltransferase SETD7-like isoform X2 [Eurytemora affinis]